jgi:acyl-coenzyme A thioesterase PaaI-like protein
MREVAKYKGCFVCGDDNQCGLKAHFYFDGVKVTTECEAERRFEGYANIYHGGITAALLDEVMIKALLAKEIFAMTVELTVRFHKAILIGQKLFLEGQLELQNGRLYIAKGKVRLENGEIAATAEGRYLKVKDEMKEQLLKSLDS